MMMMMVMKDCAPIFQCGMHEMRGNDHVDGENTGVVAVGLWSMGGQRKTIPLHPRLQIGQAQGPGRDELVPEGADGPAGGPEAEGVAVAEVVRGSVGERVGLVCVLDPLFQVNCLTGGRGVQDGAGLRAGPCA